MPVGDDLTGCSCCRPLSGGEELWGAGAATARRVPAAPARVSSRDRSVTAMLLLKGSGRVKFPWSQSVRRVKGVPAIKVGVAGSNTGSLRLLPR